MQHVVLFLVIFSIPLRLQRANICLICERKTNLNWKNKMKYVHKIHFIPSVDQQEWNGNCGEAHELEKETKLRQLLNRFARNDENKKRKQQQTVQKKEWRRKQNNEKEPKKKNAKQRFGSPSRTNRIQQIFFGEN